VNWWKTVILLYPNTFQISKQLILKIAKVRIYWESDGYWRKNWDFIIFKQLIQTIDHYLGRELCIKKRLTAIWTSFEGFLHTDYKPFGGPHYHGNLIKGWQDWVKVTFGESFFMCQILIFLEVTHVNDDNTSSIQVGKYALIDFVNQDIFSDPPKKHLYRKEYPSFCIDDNCDRQRMGQENINDWKFCNSC